MRLSDLLIAACLLGTVAVSAQDLQAVDLTAYNARRLRDQQTSMLILGGWAVGNMATSGVLMYSSERDGRYFHVMNIGWNAVNLGIAAAGYFSARRTDPASFDLYGTIKDQQRLQKTLLFNAGLDVGYVMGGLYMMERAKRDQSQRLEGFGRSIVLQGAFLFVFDVGTYFFMGRNDSKLQPLISGLYFNGNTVGLVARF